MMSSGVCYRIDSWIMKESKISTGCFFTLVKIWTGNLSQIVRVSMHVIVIYIHGFVAHTHKTYTYKEELWFHWTEHIIGQIAVLTELKPVSGSDFNLMNNW